jgi:hypothetical protein
MAGWFQASGEVTADPLSGQCREDPVATRSLDYAIHCRLSGWDDYVSCADPEAAPDRCDPDDKISREIRRALAFPYVVEDAAWPHAVANTRRTLNSTYLAPRGARSRRAARVLALVGVEDREALKERDADSVALLRTIDFGVDFAKRRRQ